MYTLFFSVRVSCPYIKVRNKTINQVLNYNAMDTCEHRNTSNVLPSFSHNMEFQ